MRAIRTFSATLIAIGGSIFAVAIDTHNDEVQAAVLVLLVAGCIAGALQPVAAWRWALVLGLSIIIGDTVVLNLGIGHPPEKTPVNWGELIALIPAFCGTYVGVGISAMVRGSAAA